MTQTALALLVIAVELACTACVQLQPHKPKPPLSPAEDACAPPHELKIVDLKVSPERIRNNQPIDFLITVRSDSNGECATVFKILNEDGRVIAQSENTRQPPGLNTYTIRTLHGYRFTKDDHCFTAVADIARTAASRDARRKECVRREGDYWVLRLADDRGARGHDVRDHRTQ